MRRMPLKKTPPRGGVFDPCEWSGRLASAETRAEASTFARTIFLRTSFVNDELASTEIGFVESFNCLLCFFRGRHNDETKTLRTTSFAVGHNDRGFYGSDFGEETFEVFGSSGVREISDVQLLCWIEFSHDGEKERKVRAQALFGHAVLLTSTWDRERWGRKSLTRESVPHFLPSAKENAKRSTVLLWKRRAEFLTIALRRFFSGF